MKLALGYKSIKRRRHPSDTRLIHLLAKASGRRSAYWAFKDNPADNYERPFYQYPAMMVPRLQREILNAIIKIKGRPQIICDPFMGSGTVLAQAMLAGCHFAGQDLNPLSLLLCQVRAECLNPEVLDTAANDVLLAAIGAEGHKNEAPIFFNKDKWFTPSAIDGLTRIRTQIQKEHNQSTRRFLWACLAETVRVNSNSRTSTFKLHIRPEEERTATAESVFATFAKVTEVNCKRVSLFVKQLQRKGYLTKTNKYFRNIILKFGNSANSIPDELGQYHVVMTSPPYGDNRTTVPYGQAAWLPLQWLDCSDIAGNINASFVESYYGIDNASLGGANQLPKKERHEALEAASTAFKKTFDLLKAKPGDALKRFASFTADLEKVLSLIALQCAPGAHVVFTLGNRRTQGVEHPLADLVKEFLQAKGMTTAWMLDRDILSKRMPSKNDTSTTIRKETLLIFRAGQT